MQILMKRFVMYLLPVLIWMGVLFYLSSLSQPQGKIISAPSPHMPPVEIMYHFGVYLVLSILLRRALMAYSVRYATGFAMGIAVLYGISDEIHQLYVPFRACELKDILIDSAGSFVMCLRHIPAWWRDREIKRVLDKK